jgi:methyltransferase
MASLFYTVIGIVIVQRLIELVISNSNEKWLLSRGAVQYGASHYKFIVLMHVCFFLSLIQEYIFHSIHKELNILNYSFLVFFFLLQFGRVWVIASLGKFWNTKIFRIKKRPLVKTGPYKYFRHPNYIIVTLEILILPLVFNLYYTAIIFTIWNAIMLSIRIKEENKALNLQYPNKLNQSS